MDTGFGKIPFTADLLGHVQTFDCGNEVYQIEVSDWIKNVGPYAVIGCMKRWGTKVWLYTTGEGDLIGFGSVGSTNWNWETSRSIPPQSHATRRVCSPSSRKGLRHLLPFN